MQIFVETRKQHAEHRPLIETPGCLFETLSGENEMSLTQMVNLMFAFNFEGFLFAEDKSVTIWLADEIVELAWSTEAITTQFEKTVDGLQIVPLQQSTLASGPVT